MTGTTQSYVDLVTELTRASRERARARARGLLAAAGLEDAATDAGERAGRLAEEMLQAGRANRRLVEALVTDELGRAADRWGFVRTDEIDSLHHEIDELRVALVRATMPDPSAARRPARARPARRVLRVRPRLARAGSYGGGA